MGTIIKNVLVRGPDHQSVVFNLCGKNKLIVDLKCINQSEYQIIVANNLI